MASAYDQLADAFTSLCIANPAYDDSVVKYVENMSTVLREFGKTVERHEAKEVCTRELLSRLVALRDLLQDKRRGYLPQHIKNQMDLIKDALVSAQVTFENLLSLENLLKDCQ